jgi:UDP-2,3-diacylglucosamine pyrophosphatase LpxH
VRTLIISDLHLGNRGGRDVLRLGVPRERLLAAIETVDRLVLLGDTVELMTRSPRDSMAAAEPVLREVGRRLGPDREVIVIAGNHDAPLVRRWALERGRQLGLDEHVDPSVTRALSRITSWLAPARVTVRYPGAWLEDRVWVTHGHYLDRHLIPESAFGLPRGRLRTAGGGQASPSDYERARRRRRGSRSPQRLLSRLAARPLATTLELSAELLRSAAVPRLPIMLQRLRLAPLTAAAIDAQMRHASLAAMGHVVTRLGVDADFVVFGHVHRTGPLNGEPWPNGATGLLNCGSWLYEPLLLDRAARPHPYWPGGAVLLESGRAPRAVGLLDELGPAELMNRADRAALQSSRHARRGHRDG